MVPQYPAGRKTPSVDLQTKGCVLNRRSHISGFSREQLAPSTHNESAPEQCMRCSVQDCMAEMVSTSWCRPRYGPLTSVHGCYTMQSSGASTAQTQTFWRSFSGIDLQGLPPRTSNCVTLAMMGMFPIEDKNSLEFDICEKQLTVKGSKSRSWLICITTLLTKYNLPAPEHMLYSTPTKGTWKTLLLSRIQEHWKCEIITEVPI